MSKSSVSRAVYFKNEALAGLTTSFAMVPETVAFAFVAGVNPLAGLYACVVAGLLTALFGGRPGMISGGAGSLAVVSVTLVALHGVEYLFAAVVLMGLIQLLVGLFGWGKFIRLVPHPVMLGFVNGLAVVILLAQLEHFQLSDAAGRHFWGMNASVATMLGLAALTIAITALLPRLTRAIPASLGAIVVLTGLVHFLKVPTPSVRDLADISGAFPLFHWPGVPLTRETFFIVLPYAVILAGVGLTESLLTQMLVDEITGESTSNDRESIGQGVANVATGFFGGMGGCAMIGQSMMNLESGGRGRASGVVQALCILCYVVFASSLIGLIPMAALAGVMGVVVFKTFAWSSLRILHKIPRADAAILVLVSVVTVCTNLATAVAVGVLISALKFAWETALRMGANRYVEEGGTVVYEIHGPLFFGSARRFLEQFDVKADPARVAIDFAHSHLYDHSALEAVAALVAAYAKAGKAVELRHLSPHCLLLLSKAGTMVNVQLSSEPHHHVATVRLRADDKVTR